jgi:hypothetical protein
MTCTDEVIGKRTAVRSSRERIGCVFLAATSSSTDRWGRTGGRKPESGVVTGTSTGDVLECCCSACGVGATGGTGFTSWCRLVYMSSGERDVLSRLSLEGEQVRQPGGAPAAAGGEGAGRGGGAPQCTTSAPSLRGAGADHLPPLPHRMRMPHSMRSDSRSVSTVSSSMRTPSAVRAGASKGSQGESVGVPVSGPASGAALAALR